MKTVAALVQLALLVHWASAAAFLESKLPLRVKATTPFELLGPSVASVELSGLQTISVSASHITRLCRGWPVGSLPSLMSSNQRACLAAWANDVCVPRRCSWGLSL